MLSAHLRDQSISTKKDKNCSLTNSHYFFVKNGHVPTEKYQLHVSEGMFKIKSTEEKRIGSPTVEMTRDYHRHVNAKCQTK